MKIVPVAFCLEIFLDRRISCVGSRIDGIREVIGKPINLSTDSAPNRASASLPSQDRIVPPSESMVICKKFSFIY